MYNAQKVSEYNRVNLQQLPGARYLITLEASVTDPMQHVMPWERAGLCRMAKIRMLKRLHHEVATWQGGDLQQSPSTAVAFAIKERMPVLFAQRCSVRVVSCGMCSYSSLVCAFACAGLDLAIYFATCGSSVMCAL